MAESILASARYPNRVAAMYDTGPEARRAARNLVRRTALSTRQVRVVDPQEPQVAPQGEVPDVARTLFARHLLMASAGIAAGIAGGAFLVMLDAAIAVARPGMVVVSLAALGGIIGLLLAGLSFPGSGRVRLSRLACRAARTGSWLVVAHGANRNEGEHARRVLAGLDSGT